MVMAAGVGSRLDPITKVVPKPLIPIANKSAMELLLSQMANYGIKEVIANTHCLAEQIHKRLGGKTVDGIKFNYLYEEELSGTAGGVKKCESFFDGEKTFLVMSGDGLTNVNLEEIIQSHINSGAIATMGLIEVPMEEVSHFGVVVVDEDGFVKEFQEKPEIHLAKSNLVNTGIYVFEKEIFNYIPANTFYDFAKNVFPSLMENSEKINTYKLSCYWSDIGTINQYKESSFDVVRGKMPLSLPYDVLESGFCSSNAIIPLSIKNEGAFIVGDNTIIEKDVEMYGYNIIGSNCVISSGSVLKNSIIWDGCIVEKNCKIENSIITYNITIKEGSYIPENSIITSNDDVKSLQTV